MDIVVKVGGAFLQQGHSLDWMDELIQLQQNGHRVYLIHGAGPYISKAYEERGVTPRFHEGQRITAPEEVSIVEDVLTKNINRTLVDQFIAKNAKVIGTSGVDGQILESDFLDRSLGQVGKVINVNSTLLKSMAEHGIVILSPVGLGQKMKFNVNADVAASSVASAFPGSRLLFLTGTTGVLDADQNVLSSIHADQIESLIEDQTIQGGMIVKVRMIKEALKSCEKVAILNTTVPQAIVNFVQNDLCEGTVFLKH